MNINILQNFSKKNYLVHPFPHFEINNCLPDNVFNILYKEYYQFINHFKEQ